MNYAPLATPIEAFATYNRPQGHSSRTVSWHTEGLEALVRYSEGQGQSTALVDCGVSPISPQS